MKPSEDKNFGKSFISKIRIHGYGEIQRKGNTTYYGIWALNRRRVIVLTLDVGIFTTYNYYTHIPTEIFGKALQNVHAKHMFSSKPSKLNPY